MQRDDGVFLNDGNERRLGGHDIEDVSQRPTNDVIELKVKTQLIYLKRVKARTRALAGRPTGSGCCAAALSKRA